MTKKTDRDESAVDGTSNKASTTGEGKRANRFEF